MQQKKLESLKYSVVVYSVNRTMLYIVTMLVCGRWRILRETAVAKSHPVLVGPFPAPRLIHRVHGSRQMSLKSLHPANRSENWSSAVQGSSSYNPKEVLVPKFAQIS